MPPITRPPIDRTSIQARIAKTYSDLEGAKAEHAVQSLQLAHRPDDATVLDQVRSLEAEIAGHRLNIGRLEAAQQAGQQAESEESKADKANQANQLRSKVAALSDQLGPLLTRMVESLESVGPDLALYVSLAAQRREAAHAALRLTAGAKAMQSVFANATRIDGHNALIDGLIGAVVRSGIGAVGPSLSPHVVTNPPIRVPSLSDAERGLQLDRERLLEAIDHAINPQPVTLDQE